MYGDSLDKVSNNLIYYNVNIRGPKDSESIVNAEFRENRTVAILENPSEWQIGIVRFNISGIYIPIFRWGTQYPQPYEDDTLKVYFTYNGISVSKSLTFFQKTTHFADSLVRNVWNFTDFLTYLNNAVESAFNEIKVQPGFPSTRAPAFYLDPTTRLISMFVQQSMDSNSPVKMGFSNLLYSYFPSFPVVEEEDLFPKRYVYFLDMYSTPKNNILYGGAIGYEIIQEFPTISLWNGVDKILFESSTIPVDPELEQSSTDIVQRTVFDFTLDNENIDNRSEIFYNNTGGQRYANLLSSYPLKKLDLQISILYKDGTVEPLRLNKLDHATCKFEFRRRVPVFQVTQ